MRKHEYIFLEGNWTQLKAILISNKTWAREKREKYFNLSKVDIKSMVYMKLR